MIRKITTNVNDDLFKEAKRRKMVISDILNSALNERLYGDVIDTTLLYKLKKERSELMNKYSSLTIKEQEIQRKKERLQLEIDALSKEIGAMSREETEREQSETATLLLRVINEIILDNNYNITIIEKIAEQQIAEIKKVMPQFDLAKQIEVIKKYND